MEPIEINTLAPPSFHPDVLSVHEDALNIENSHGARALEAGREALAAVYNWHTRVEEADRACHQQDGERRRVQKSQPHHYSVRGGPLQIAHGREADVCEAAGKSMVAASTMVDRRLEVINGAVDVLEKIIDQRTEDKNRKTPEGLAVATEIRNHIKSLPNVKRMDFLRNAISAGDKQTAAAILRAPAYLSGLEPEAHENMMDHARHAFAPMEFAQLQACRAMKGRIAEAQVSLMLRNCKLQEKLGALSQASNRAANKLKELAK